MMEENRQSDDSATERKPSRSHVAAELTVTRQRQKRLQLPARGEDSGSLWIDELHAERRVDHERRENTEMRKWKERRRTQDKTIHTDVFLISFVHLCMLFCTQQYCCMEDKLI